MSDYGAVYDEGWHAFKAATPFRSPYGPGSHARAFAAGWHDAQTDAELVRPASNNPASPWDETESPFPWDVWNGN